MSLSSIMVYALYGLQSKYVERTTKYDVKLSCVYALMYHLSINQYIYGSVLTLYTGMYMHTECTIVPSSGKI